MESEELVALHCLVGGGPPQFRLLSCIMTYIRVTGHLFMLQILSNKIHSVAPILHAGWEPGMRRTGRLWSSLTSHFLVSPSALSRPGAQERQSEGPGEGRQLCGRKRATLHSDSQTPPGRWLGSGCLVLGEGNPASEPQVGDGTHS